MAHYASRLEVYQGKWQPSDSETKLQQSDDYP